MTDSTIKYLTVRQYAKLTNKTYNHIHLLVARKKLPFFRVGDVNGPILIQSDVLPTERGEYVDQADCGRIIPPPPPELLMPVTHRTRKRSGAIQTGDLQAVMHQFREVSPETTPSVKTVVHTMDERESGRPRKTDRVSGITYLTRAMLKTADVPTILAFTRVLSFFDKNRDARLNVLDVGQISGLTVLDSFTFMGQLRETGWVQRNDDETFSAGERFVVNEPFEEAA